MHFSSWRRCGECGRYNGHCPDGPKHIQLLKRNTDQILIVLHDSDSAGLNAANRAVNMLQDHEFSVKVALMPDNLDPDDYIKGIRVKKSFVSEVIGASLTCMAFKMHYLRRGKNVNNSKEIEFNISKKSLKKFRDCPMQWRGIIISGSYPLNFPFHWMRWNSSSVRCSLRNARRDIAAASSPKEMALQYEHKLKPAHHNAETRVDCPYAEKQGYDFQNSAVA